MKAKSLNHSQIIAKNVLKQVEQKIFRSLLMKQAEQKISNTTVQQMQNQLNLNFQLMFLKDKKNELKQIDESLRQNPDNYGSGVCLIKGHQNKQIIAKKVQKNNQSCQNLPINSPNQINKPEFNQQNENNKKTIIKKSRIKTKKLAKSQKFIGIISQQNILKQKTQEEENQSLRIQLDEKRKRIQEIQQEKKQSKRKINKKQKQISQKFKNLHQFSYNFDATLLEVKQSAKDFMTNRQDFLEMKTNILRKVVKRKQFQLGNQNEEQVFFQNKNKKIIQNSVKAKKHYHQQINLNTKSINSILQMFSSKELLQKGIKIRQFIKGNQKQRETKLDLQKKFIEKMNRTQFKDYIENNNFVPTSKNFLQRKKKITTTSQNNLCGFKQPEIKINNLVIQEHRKPKHRYNSYQCVTQPSESALTQTLFIRKMKRSNNQKSIFSQNQDKYCKIQVRDRKNFQNFLNYTRCS